MVKVEVCSPLESGAKITLNDTIDLWLSKDKYKEIILAQRTAEGAENYYFHYHALRCEISEAAAQELIDLGVRVEDLDDLKNFRV
ncbi:hypothetical protein ACG9X6_22870 [Acinetobacter guillouiae]|mgnify:CR=1 FL=1|uniref:hypothetical protein n=1 Tax=Acinetobacter guillouiae TaxID=106649 RepID=UPI003AF419E0